jgi:hypothetical protein
MVSTLVFPPPGCEDAQRIVEPFAGFDILSTPKGRFANLLNDSSDLSQQTWIRGSGFFSITSNFDAVNWYTYDDYILEKSGVYVLSNGFGDNLVITNSNNSFLGQEIPVNGSTVYTVSFYAKRGTATELTYGIYDLTNNEVLVEPTNYYDQTNSVTYSKISFTFETNNNTEKIIFYPLWVLGLGSPGSVNIAAPQVELGDNDTAYDATKKFSFARLGLEPRDRIDYGITTLATFSDPEKNFEPLYVLSQNKVKWNVVDDFIFENDILDYTSESGNTVLNFKQTTTRPYNVGDTVTISATSPDFRQNFTVTEFTETSITIDSTDVMPINGAVISNPNPSIYPQSFEVLNLLTYQRGVTNITKARENFYLSLLAPNDRAIKYYLNRDIGSSAVNLTQGLVKSVNNFKTPVEVPRSGRVLPLSKIADVSSPLPVIKLDQLIPGPGDNYASVWPSGIFRLSQQFLNGTNFYIDQFTDPDSFRSLDYQETTFKLEPYHNQGLTIGSEVRIVNVDNFQLFDTVDDFIFEGIFYQSTQTADYPSILYFNPILENSLDKIKFNKGAFVKIFNLSTGETLVTEILNSSVNSITVNLTSSIANDILGNIVIQDASPFVYSKEDVAVNNRSLQLPIVLITQPRDNLFISEQGPLSKDRSLKYFINRDLSGGIDLLENTAKNLELFDTDLRLPPDISIRIVGENTELKYNTVLWYKFDQDILTFTTEEITQKILYFQDQQTLPFKVGDTVRLHNPDIGYSKLVTVLDSSNRFIVIDIVDDFPGIGNLFIENLTTSVYPQRFVSLYPGEQPKTPRDNLFYFEFLPTLRAPKLPVFFDTGLELVTDFFRDNIRVIGTVTDLQSNSLEKDSIKVRAASDNRPVAKLSAAVKVIADSADRGRPYSVDNFRSQLTVRPTATATTPAERFYYFNLAQGLQASKIFTSQFETDGNFLRVSAVKSITNLLTDRTTLAANPIDLFKIQNFEVIDTPQLNTLEKDYTKIIGLGNFFNTTSLSAAVKVIAAQVVLSAESLRSAVTVKETSSFKNIDLLDKFITRDYVDLGTAQTDFLTRDLFEIRDTGNKNNLENIFLNKELFNLRESIKAEDRGVLTAVSVVKEVSENLQVANVKAMTILRPSNTFSMNESLEDYNDQFETIITNNFPLTARENFYYFNLAPGFKSNSSITQGNLFDTVYNQQTFEFLNKFEIENFNGGPSYEIVSQDQGLTANTVLYYINDLDILTVSTRSIDSITVYFNNVDKFLNPYPIGTLVVLTRFDTDTGTNIQYTSEVLDSGLNFVKIAQIDQWKPTWKFTNIATPYSEVYPTDLVKTTVSPTTPREVLRYSQIAPGYRTNNTLQQGYSFDVDYVFDLSKVISLERDTARLVEDFSNTLLNRTFSLEKSLMLLNEIYPDSVKLDGRIEFGKFGEDFNEFAVVIVPETKGLVIRLKTNRYQDVAAPKKEPIQFWN